MASKRHVKSNRFTGVYYENLENGDKSYYITFKDENNKLKWLKIGLHSEGIREPYCHQKRNEYTTKLRLGEEIQHKAAKKKQTLFLSVAKLYLDEREQGRSKQSSKSIIEKHLNYFNNTDIAMMDKSMIESYKKDYLKSLSITDKTKNNILTILSAILGYAQDKEIIKAKPTINKIKAHTIKRERFLSIEEIKELLALLKTKDNRLYLFTLLALTTGARVGTILHIKVKDIDYNHNTITLYNFKTKHTYTAFLTAESKEELQKQTEQKEPNDYIFNGKEGNKLTDTSIQKPLRQVLNTLFNSKLSKNDTQNRVVIHTLRHTFASHLAIKGTPLYTIQKLLDHKDITQTQRYAKLTKQSGAEEVRGLYS